MARKTLDFMANNGCHCCAIVHQIQFGHHSGQHCRDCHGFPKRKIPVSARFPTVGRVASLVASSAYQRGHATFGFLRVAQRPTHAHLGPSSSVARTISSSPVPVKASHNTVTCGWRSLGAYSQKDPDQRGVLSKCTKWRTRPQIRATCPQWSTSDAGQPSFTGTHLRATLI